VSTPHLVESQDADRARSRFESVVVIVRRTEAER
jgi:hypothetical protein